ncbi:uncharacterized protein EDB91DRAFT_1080662 [Suillus paluster]|uniref:uncharacterized protein n=1 Tax=Suillus paluster TaxID=48578 RepID=UPI001B877589|nr:uncharacterized protein EDB91DRAFT_1080662 [Suillus paluster]KAG1744550.1 hypothetical protein EDB91DRAFT_1080662 [Suillus paluster]
MAAGFSLRKELQHPRGDDVVFDYCNPIHPITAAAAGGLEGQLHGLKRNEDIEIWHVEGKTSKQGRKAEKRRRWCSRHESQPTLQMPAPEPQPNSAQMPAPE